MTRLTRNFIAAEFGEVPEALMGNALIVARALQEVRDLLEQPIIITSGWRSETRNKRVGGASRSDHIACLAADFTCGSMSSELLCQRAVVALQRSATPWDQLIWYRNSRHVHLGMGERERLQWFRGD